MPLSICTECRSVGSDMEGKCRVCGSKTVRADSIAWVVLERVNLFSSPEGFPDQYFLYLIESGLRKLFCPSEKSYDLGSEVYPDYREGILMCMMRQ